MNRRFFLNRFFNSRVFVVHHHLEFQVYTLDGHHVSFTHHFDHLALGALKSAGVYDHLVAEHDLPVRDWLLRWAVPK